MRTKLAFLTAFLSVAAADVALAQTPTGTAAPSNHSETALRVESMKADTTGNYDTDALRLESFWGDYRVVRGTKGTEVGTVGLLRSFDVEKLVSRSPVAAAEARVYQTNHRLGSVVGSLGTVALISGLIVSSNSSNNASSPVLIIAGAGAIGWGAQHLNTAYSALSRALWWYNRDLPR